MQATAQFLLSEAAFLKEFFQQRVVRLGNYLDKLRVQILRILRVRLGALTAAIGLERDEFLVQHIQHLVEARSDIHGHSQRHDLVAKILPQTFQRGIKTHMLLVEAVHRHEMRHPGFARPFPHPGGAHFHTIGGIHSHQRGVAHAQRAQRLGQEIEITRRVDEVQLLVGMLHAERGGVDGYLPFLFGVVIVADCRAGLNAAQPVDGAGRRFNALGQHRLARRSMAHDCEITDVL